MKDITKAAVVLCVIALVSGVLLGLVYQVTYIDPEEVLNKKLNKAYVNEEGFTTIEAENYKPDEGVKADLLGAYKAKGKDTVYVYHTSSVGYKAGVELMIVVEDNKIIKILKVASQETYTKPFEEDYTDQYKNIDLTTIDNFDLVKKPVDNDDEKIVAFSTATKTSTAIINGINTAAAYHRNIVGGAV